MNRKTITHTLFWILSASIMIISGCNKITTENYDKLKSGMQYDEVVKILGEADKCDGALGIKNCVWGDRKKHIEVNFIANKALMFSAKGL